MFLEIFSYLKNFSSVTAVTEDLLLKCYSMTTFILLFMSILVTGKTQQNKSLYSILQILHHYTPFPSGKAYLSDPIFCYRNTDEV